MTKRKLPPNRVCPGCRRSFRGFTDECPDCRKDGAENAQAGAEMAREARKARRRPVAFMNPDGSLTTSYLELSERKRQERIDSLEPRPSSVPYNEFPEGF